MIVGCAASITSGEKFRKAAVDASDVYMSSLLQLPLLLLLLLRPYSIHECELQPQSHIVSHHLAQGESLPVQ